MQDLDKIVATIRAAKDGSAAAAQLQQQFGLSSEQVPATHVLLCMYCYACAAVHMLQDASRQP